MNTTFQNDDISTVTDNNTYAGTQPSTAQPSNNSDNSGTQVSSFSLPPPALSSVRSVDIDEPTNYLIIFSDGRYEQMTNKDVVLMVIEQFFRLGYINRLFQPTMRKDTMMKAALDIMGNLGIRNTNRTVIQKIPYSLLVFIYLCYEPPKFLVRDNEVGADIILPPLITELRELNYIGTDHKIPSNMQKALNNQIIVLLKYRLHVRNLDNSEIKAVPEYFLHFIQNLPLIEEM